MKRFFKYMICVAAALTATGCSDDNEPLVLPDEIDILSFEVDGVAGAIDRAGSSIRVTVPAGTDLSRVEPRILLTEGAVVTPASGESVDFRHRKVNYRVEAGNLYRDYEVSVVRELGGRIAFVGWEDIASSRAEEQAWSWLSETSGLENVDKVSFWDVETEAVSLDDYAVVWWHCDGLADPYQLPFRAYRTKVIALFREYLENGGSLLLTTYASEWVKELEVAEDGFIPNNLWGGEMMLAEDATAGISFRGNESHPLFQGFDAEGSSLPLMSGGVRFQEHNVIWHTGWQDYESSLSVWAERTGGKYLVTDMDGENPRVLIAEFPATSSRAGRVLTFGMGCYQWDAEGNAFRENIERLTRNAIEYLVENRE